jgi:hypothetical protein
MQIWKKICNTSMRVELGMGTGADSNRKIHVSISFASWITIEDVNSEADPVKTDHTESLHSKQKKKSQEN